MSEYRSVDFNPGFAGGAARRHLLRVERRVGARGLQARDWRSRGRLRAADPRSHDRCHRTTPRTVQPACPPKPGEGRGRPPYMQRRPQAVVYFRREEAQSRRARGETSIPRNQSTSVYNTLFLWATVPRKPTRRSPRKKTPRRAARRRRRLPPLPAKRRARRRSSHPPRSRGRGIANGRPYGRARDCSRPGFFVG